MRRVFISATVAALLAAATAPAHAADTIRALAPTRVGFAPALVADTLGYYAEEGLEVDFKFENHRSKISSRCAANFSASFAPPLRRTDA